jgi:amino acid transporter
MSSSSSAKPGGDGVETLRAGIEYGELRRNSLGLPSALAMSMAFLCPTINVIFIAPLIAKEAGIAAPLAMLLGTLGIGLMAFALANFASRVSSAGSFYSFITHGLGSSAGFVMGWLFLFAYALQSPLNTNLFGYFVSDFIKSETGINIPWWVLMTFIVAVVGALGWWSIHESMRVDLVFVVVELTIIGILVLLIIFKGGAQGQVGGAFSFKSIPTGFSGLGLAFIYVVFAFFGFESSTTVAEEVRNPRRNIPIALIGSVVFSGIYMALCIYGIVVGYGPSHIGALSSSSSPIIGLATRYIGHWYATLVSLAAISASIANLIAIHNANFRIFYAMGRERLIPRALGKTHPRHQTPHIAIVSYSILALGLGLLFGSLWGPVAAFGDVGYFSSLGIMPIYIMVCVALIAFIWRKRRAEFNWLAHGLCPILAIAIMVFGLYTSVHPLPAYPENFMPFFVIGWFLIGLGWMLYLRKKNPQKLALIGQVVFNDVPLKTVQSEETGVAS